MLNDFVPNCAGVYGYGNDLLLYQDRPGPDGAP